MRLKDVQSLQEQLQKREVAHNATTNSMRMDNMKLQNEIAIAKMINGFDGASGGVDPPLADTNPNPGAAPTTSASFDATSEPVPVPKQPSDSIPKHDSEPFPQQQAEGGLISATLPSREPIPPTPVQETASQITVACAAPIIPALFLN